MFGKYVFRMTAVLLCVLLLLGCSNAFAYANGWTCRNCNVYVNGANCYRCGSGPNWEMIGTGIVYRLGVGKTLNLREGPGTEYAILAEMVNDTYVSVFSVNGKWAEIDYHGVHGYAHTDYLDIALDDPAPSTYRPNTQHTGTQYSNTKPNSPYSSISWNGAYASPTYYMTNRGLSTRTGPGTQYDGKGKTMEYSSYANKMVPVYSAAWDARNEVWWLQVEVGNNNSNRRRVYTGLKRFDGVRINDLLVEGILYSNVMLTRSVYPLYGPGYTYEQMNTRVDRGVYGDVISLEGEFAQFEYYEYGYFHRCWVQISDLSFSNALYDENYGSTYEAYYGENYGSKSDDTSMYSYSEQDSTSTYSYGNKRP